MILKLLPNLDKHPDKTTDNPLNKDSNYKVVYNWKLDGKKQKKKGDNKNFEIQWE